MEDMAAMLQQVAGGLQQSFGVVFERVGESLAQSAHMMQVMNEMMETALLHNLVLTGVVRADASSSRRRPELHVTVDNRSQIALSDVTLTVTVENGRGDGGDVVYQEVLATLGAGSHHELLVPMDPASVGLEGCIELAFASPGTKETLRKPESFRIRLLCLAHVKEVATPVDSSIEGQLCASSDSIKLAVLREVLQVGAFNALRTGDEGHYVMSLAAPATLKVSQERLFHVSIFRKDDAPTGARVLIATAPPTPGEDTETLKRVCQDLVVEMERW